jgi:transposase InsO family protein
LGEKREIVCRYVGKGLNVNVATTIAGIKRSSYYYRPNGKPKGKKPSTHTFKYGVGMVTNDAVVEEILKLITPEYNDYGYKVSAELLKRQGYLINHKKVKRLMKENNLLHPQIIKPEPLNRIFIRYTVPPLDGPFKTIEADIKYINIHEQNRNAFLITFLCTFCRYAPVWALEYTMPAKEIKNLVMDLTYHPVVRENLDQNTIVMIRTDNGPQFIARILASALDDLGLKHEFINPGTPQQNAHIESFHSTVTRLVCSRNVFRNLEHARQIFSEFYFAYNNTRVMKALLYYPPKQFLELWKSGVVGIKKDKRNKEIFFFREKPHPFDGIGSSPEDFLVVNKNSNFEIPVLIP